MDKVNKDCYPVKEIRIYFFFSVVNFLYPSVSFVMPLPFSMGHIISPLSVRSSVCPVCPVRPVRNTSGFRAISFERIGVLD